MTAIRIGVPARRSRRMRLKGYRRNSTEPVNIRNPDGTIARVVTMSDVWYDLDDWLCTPSLRSILSTLLRSTNIWPEEDAEAAVADGLAKEITVTQRRDLSPTVKYPFFVSDAACFTEQLHPDIPFNPFLTLSIRFKFLNWRRSISQRILYPQVSNKSVGETTRDNFWKDVCPGVPSPLLPETIVTTADLERAYSENGHRIAGPCEVRYAWKYNDLKPRTYYAIGGDAFFSSKYVRVIFNTICEMWRSTHPQSRYSFHGFNVLNLPQDIFVIYDYAAFTSRLVDFVEFCRQLARFCEGTKVLIFDTFAGIIEEDLGQLLKQYNDVCNDHATFSVAKILGQSGRYDEVILEQHVAGLLGVYGNIVGSTALHGIVGMHICGGEFMGNFIGDDAGIVIQNHSTEFGDFENVREAIRTIGDIADPKFEVFDTDEGISEECTAWHYVKRPIMVLCQTIYTKWMPEFPIIADALAIPLKHITTPSKSFGERRRTFVRQVSRYLNSLTEHRSLVTDVDWEMILAILKDVYYRLRLPTSGSLPKLNCKIPKDQSAYGDTVAVPPLFEETLERGWWTILRENAIQEVTFALPRFDEEDELPGSLEVGVTFCHRSIPALSVLTKIGYLEKTMIFEERLVTDGTLQLLDDYVSGDLKPLYCFATVVDYPLWTSMLPLLLTH